MNLSEIKTAHHNTEKYYKELTKIETGWRGVKRKWPDPVGCLRFPIWLLEMAAQVFLSNQKEK